MTVNIKDVIITMTPAQQRTLDEDKKKLLDLALQAQAADTAFKDFAGDVAETFEDFGITKSGLVNFAKAKAKTGSVNGEVEKLESKIEEFQFLDGQQGE